jgi:hypothetical protein
MDDEENMLKSYFKEYKKPTNEDPTIMSSPIFTQEGRPTR